MVFIVEMAHATPEAEDFRLYSCGSATWNSFLNMGKTFGWEPMGTIPDPANMRSVENYIECFKPTYEPNEWAHSKRVSANDAHAWAEALKKALAAYCSGKVAIFEKPGPTLLKDEMTTEDFKAANAMPSEMLPSFIEFLSLGEFVFAWDD